MDTNNNTQAPVMKVVSISADSSSTQPTTEQVKVDQSSSYFIEKTLFNKGLLAATPCLSITIKDNQILTAEDVNAIFNEVLPTKFLHVFVRGTLTKNPEIRTLVSGLSAKGRIVTFSTSGGDNISPLRLNRNVRFILNFFPPTGNDSTLNPSSLPILKEEDELCFLISDEQSYRDSLTYIGTKMFRSPIFLTVLSSKVSKDQFRELKNSFLQDSENIKTKIRLIYL